MEAMIVKLKDIQFHSDIIVKKAKLELLSGNLTALIGESGSGKSTIIDSIIFENEFLESFVYQEKDYAKATKEEQQSFIFEHMGIVHQQPEFLKDLTIKLHIEMIKELYGIKEDEEIQNWISSLELKELLEKYPVTVTRIAHGLPMGGHLDYADELTLIKAIEGRKKM